MKETSGRESLIILDVAPKEGMQPACFETGQCVIRVSLFLDSALRRSEITVGAVVCRPSKVGKPLPFFVQ